MTGTVLEGLLTWLWQGSVLAGLASLALRGSRAGSASTRYLVWWATLAAIVVLPLAGSWVAIPAISGADTIARPETAVVFPAARSLVTMPSVPGWIVMLVVAGWLGVVACQLRGVARAMAQLAACRRRCRPLPPARQRALARWMAQRRRGRRTRLCVSDDLAVPAFLGLSRPTVAIPRRLLTTLTDDGLDLVVLHEHAHAQRWDDWTLLLQTVVLALVGMHPGIRLAARALDRERELACDDRVVAQGGCPRLYALSVTKVAELTLADTAPALAPGMSTARGALTRRVERLLEQTGSPAERRLSPVVLSTAVGAIACVVALFGVLPPLVSTAPRGGPVTAVHRPASDTAPAALPVNSVSRPDAVQPQPARVGPANRVERPANTIRARDTSATGAADAGITLAVQPAPAPALLRVTETQAALRAPGGHALDITMVPVIAGAAPTGWRPAAPPLVSRAVAPPWTTAIFETPGPPNEPSPWRRIADGGAAIGSKTAHAGTAIGSKTAHAGTAIGRRTAEAGKTTAGVFTRFGSAIGRAFTGGP